MLVIKDIFERIELLNSEVREELALVSEPEFVNLDSDLQCHEYEGDTVDKVANAVAREVGNENQTKMRTRRMSSMKAKKKLLKTASWSKPRKISNMY